MSVLLFGLKLRDGYYNMIGWIRKVRFVFCKATEVIEREKTKISKFQLKNYSDSVKLAITGGHGGNGIISYFTDKRIRRGTPYGGDGGQGGSIIVQAHSNMHDLSHLRLKTIEGVDGQSGGTLQLTKGIMEGWVKTGAKLC